MSGVLVESNATAVNTRWPQHYKVYSSHAHGCGRRQTVAVTATREREQSNRWVRTVDSACYSYQGKAKSRAEHGATCKRQESLSEGVPQTNQRPLSSSKTSCATQSDRHALSTHSLAATRRCEAPQAIVLSALGIRTKHLVLSVEPGALSSKFDGNCIALTATQTEEVRLAAAAPYTGVSRRPFHAALVSR